MGSYVIGVGAILGLMLGWVAVQQLARRYALRHPESGPAPAEGAGCGTACLCTAGERCSRDTN